MKFFPQNHRQNRPVSRRKSLQYEGTKQIFLLPTGNIKGKNDFRYVIIGRKNVYRSVTPL